MEIDYVLTNASCSMTHASISKFEPHKAPDIKEQYQNDYGSYIGQQAYVYVYQQRNHMQQSLGY